MLIKSEQLSVGSLIKNVMLKYLFWASYILRLCAQTCTPNRHALNISGPSSKGRMFCQSPTLAHIAGHYLRCTEGILQAHSFPVYLYQARQGRIKINMQYAYKGAVYLLTYCINKYWFATRSFSDLLKTKTD